MSNQKFSVGDDVESNYKGCKGFVFTVARVHENNSCASKCSIVAHLKGDPSKEIKDGTVIDGVNYGIDSGWFRKVL